MSAPGQESMMNSPAVVNQLRVFVENLRVWAANSASGGVLGGGNASSPKTLNRHESY